MHLGEFKKQLNSPSLMASRFLFYIYIILMKLSLPPLKTTVLKKTVVSKHYLRIVVVVVSPLTHAGRRTLRRPSSGHHTQATSTKPQHSVHATHAEIEIEAISVVLVPPESHR